MCTGSVCVQASSHTGWVRSVVKNLLRIPNYIPSLSRWLPRFNITVINCLWKDSVETVMVRDVEDLMQVMYLAQKTRKTVKYVGGSYPINDKNCDYLISAREMKSVVAFNPDKGWITAEGGAKLGDILLFLRDRGYTLELYGSVPNLALADALAIGSSGSNGTISLVVHSCEVVQSRGSVCHVTWPVRDSDLLHETLSQYSLTVVENLSTGTGPSEAGDIHYTCTRTVIDATDVQSEFSLGSSLCSYPFAAPSLDAIICGLGLFGAVGLCTLKCVDFHLAHEDTQVLTLREMIQRRHNFRSCLYIKIRCFPLIGKFLVTRAVSVPPCQADWQPVWKLFLEKALSAAYTIIANISPFVTVVLPSSAVALSTYQFRLLSWAYIMRRNYSFWPQKIVPGSSVYNGEEYVLPDSQINVALRGMIAWADRNRHLSCKPFKLCLRSLKHSKMSPPILAPGNHNHVWSLWTDYFSGFWMKWRRRSAKSEFEAIMARAMAWRTWSAAPLRVAQHPHPGIGRIHALRYQLGADKMFRSAYIQDDLEPVCEDEVASTDCQNDPE